MKRISTDYEPGPSLDDIAKQHGYADYSGYCDEYYEGHTGCELGEPAVWEPDLDDFESGIFEAMASGCLVISEKLNEKTLIDLGVEQAIIQIESPFDLYKKLQYLENNPNIIKNYQKKSKCAINNNTWHDRAKIMKHKFEEICDK